MRFASPLLAGLLLSASVALGAAQAQTTTTPDIATQAKTFATAVGLTYLDKSCSVEPVMSGYYTCNAQNPLDWMSGGVLTILCNGKQCVLAFPGLVLSSK